jgi:hypothetical protein
MREGRRGPGEPVGLPPSSGPGCQVALGADRLGCSAGGFVSVGLRYVGSVVERQPGFHRLAREADGLVVAPASARAMIIWPFLLCGRLTPWTDGCRAPRFWTRGDPHRTSCFPWLDITSVATPAHVQSCRNSTHAP